MGRGVELTWPGRRPPAAPDPAAIHELAVFGTGDPRGRLVITPVEQLRGRLMETFGIWRDRTDMTRDGVEYMDAVRRGKRLDSVEVRYDEAD